MPRCKQCRVSAKSEAWRRYRNGRLKVLCPECDDRVKAARKRNEAAKAAGYPSWANTPQYKRLQSEAEAAKQGRTLTPYVSQSQRRFRAGMLQVERIADGIRAHWALKWLKPFRNDRWLYWNIPEFREQARAKSRNQYWAHLAENRQKTADYKRAHQDRVMEHHAERAGRIAATSDGSITVPVIRALKREAKRCAYCDALMFRLDKVTDHMIPLCQGGEHTLRNLVICCRACNARKASLGYEEWAERIGPEHRARVVALYQFRYGVALRAIA